MRFVCNGRVYVAAEMQKFRTQDPANSSIYLTRDGRATFVVSHDQDGTLSAHQAGTGEIINLSRRYNLSDLLRAFPARFAPVQILFADDDGEDAERPPSNRRNAVRPLASGTESAGALA